MTGFFLALTVWVPTAAGLWWLTRWQRRAEVCRVSGCRRLATSSVWMWHPAGGATLQVCEQHRRRWDAAPYDQDLDKDTDLGRWGEELA